MQFFIICDAICKILFYIPLEKYVTNAINAC